MKTKKTIRGKKTSAVASKNRILMFRTATSCTLLLTLLACTSNTATATQSSAPSTKGFHTCDIEGWVIDTDPAGLNVRAAPSRSAPILGTIPSYVVSHMNKSFGIPVTVDAAQDGWFRIKAEGDDPERSHLPPRPVYRGQGWVAANMIRFQMYSGMGFTAPDASSQTLIDLGSDWLTSMGTIVRVRDCKDKWVEVDFRLQYRRGPEGLSLEELPPDKASTIYRAWFWNPCDNQETTCDRGEDQRNYPRQAVERKSK